MDDRLAKIEEGLERLIPRGLSDGGMNAMEARIDELAAEASMPLERGPGLHRTAIAAAAVVAAGAGLTWWHLAGDPAGPATVATDESLSEGFETVSAALQVSDRFDGGWVYGDGTAPPYRYHGYEVTDQQELIDDESGYQVRVQERREEWIPVRMTSL